MSSYYTDILVSLLSHKGKGNHFSKNDRYLLSGHTYHDISVPTRRAVAKEWMKKNRDISTRDFITVVDALFRGDSYDEKTLASIVLGYSAKVRAEVSFRQLDEWLRQLNGWAEIDSLCQGTFTDEDILPKWDAWQKFIQKLSKDKNINKRRAALVFLTQPLRKTGDSRVLDLSLEMVDALKHEKSIVITKAVSWLLRSGVEKRKKEIAKYIAENKETLPAIAVRETTRKIQTGRK